MLPLDEGLADGLVVKPQDAGVAPDLVDKGLEQHSLGIVLHFHGSERWAHPCSALDRGRGRRLRWRWRGAGCSAAGCGAKHRAPAQPRAPPHHCGRTGGSAQKGATAGPAHRPPANGERGLRVGGRGYVNRGGRG